MKLTAVFGLCWPVLDSPDNALCRFAPIYQISSKCVE